MSPAMNQEPISDPATRSGRFCPPALLASLVAEGRLTDGHATVIGLGDVRDALGRRWGERSAGAFDLVIDQARRLFAPGDVIERVGEVEVLVVAPGVDPLLSRGLAAKALTEALKQLIGEARPSAVVIKAVTGFHNGEIVSRPLEPEELAGARVAADQAGRARRAADPAGADNGEASVESITTFDGRCLDVGFAFDTVYDLGRSAVAGYRIEPRLAHARTGAPLTAAERIGLLASDTERVDLMTLDRALGRLAARRDQGGDPPSLILSVSFLTASSQRARTKLLLRPGPLRDLVRASVIWAISDVPDGAPPGRLTEIAALLRPFGRAVFADSKLGGAPMKMARAAGIAGLIIDPLSNEISDIDAALWLLQAGKIAHRAAPALIAANLGSQALLPMAAAAGFTHATVRRGVVLLAA